MIGVSGFIEVENASQKSNYLRDDKDRNQKQCSLELVNYKSPRTADKFISVWLEFLRKSFQLKVF